MAKKKLQFEDALLRLEEILVKLDSSDISLADAVDLYKEGMDMVAICNEKMEQAQGELKVYANGIWQKDDELNG